MPSDSRSSRKRLTERRQSSPPSRPWSFPFDPPIDPAACRAAPLPRQFPFRRHVSYCRQQQDNFCGLPDQNFPRRRDGDAGRHQSPGKLVPSTPYRPSSITMRASGSCRFVSGSKRSKFSPTAARSNASSPGK